LFAYISKEGVEGREEREQETHKVLALRQSKSTLYSSLLRAQTGRGLPPALPVLGRRGGRRQSTS